MDLMGSDSADNKGAISGFDRLAHWFLRNKLAMLNFGSALLMALGQGFSGDEWSEKVYSTKLSDSTSASIQRQQENERKKDGLQTIAMWVSIFSAAFLATGALIETRRRDRAEIENRSLKENRFTANKKILELREELVNSSVNRIDDVRWLMELYLRALAYRNLQFRTVGDHCDRITLFSHDGGNAFTPFGRVCTNPEFNSPGRPRFEKSQGLVAKAWQSVVGFKNTYPDPAVDRDGYFAALRDDGIPREEAKDMRMKSRMYYTRRIDFNGVPLAVLAIESTNQGRWKKRDLDQIFSSEHEQQYLSTFLGKMRGRIPDLTANAKLGL